MPRLGTTEINSSDPRLNRNLVINGDMKLSQRTTGTIVGTSGFQYVLDRHISWFTDVASVSAPTINQSSLPAGFGGIDNSGQARSMRMHGTITSLAPAPTFNRLQRIESIRLRPQRSNVISVGMWIWSNNFQDVSLQILQPTTGTPDNWASSAIIPGGLQLIPVNEAGWTFVKIENIQLTNLDGLEIRAILVNPAATVFTDTYMTEMMCNWGPTLRPFRLMADNADQEKMLAQRYYEVWTGRMRSALQSGVNEMPVPMKVSKRTNPLITVIGDGATPVNITTEGFSLNTSSAATGNIDVRMDAEL